jgi:hypothetical protein
MALTAFKEGRAFLHGFDISANLQDLTTDLDIDTTDVTNLASGGWKEFIGSLKDSVWDWSGFHDVNASTGEPNITLFDDVTASNPRAATFVPLIYSIAAGDYCVFARKISAKWTVGEKIGAAAKMALHLVGNSPTIAGRILEKILGADPGGGTTGVSAALQLTAVSATQRLYVAVHVLSKTGTNPTLDLVIQSDTVGFASPATQITVPQFTGVGSYFGYVDGAITDDYYRVSRTVGGTGSPAFTYVVVIGIQ